MIVSDGRREAKIAEKAKEIMNRLREEMADAIDEEAAAGTDVFNEGIAMAAYLTAFLNLLNQTKQMVKDHGGVVWEEKGRGA